MRRAAGWAMLAGALMISVPASSRADDKASRDAQARFEEGLGRVKAGDFEAARVSFAQAYAVLRKPEILWNLALSEQKSGHLVDALGHFKQLAREGTTDADRANARKHVSELMAETGHIEVLAPDGAKLSVDGTSAGLAPLPEPLDVFPGRHRVEAMLPQGVKTAEADTIAGQVAHVSFMVAATQPAGAGAGQAGAGEASAGAVAGAGASGGGSPGPGTGAGAREAGGAGADAVTPEGGSPAGPTRTIVVAVIGGVAVVSGALGLGFGLASSSNSDSATTLRQHNPDCSGSTSSGCQQLQSTVNAQHEDAVVSRVFWATGGVLAVGAVATWLVWPKTSHVAASTGVSFTLAPSVGPGGAGATAVGSF